MAQQYPQQGSDPQITYTDPMAYALYLRGRGLNPIQIDDLMRQRFGPGETPEERARKQQKQQEQAGWAQVGGAVGGSVLAGEALAGFPNVKSALGYGKPTPTAPETPSVIGATRTGGTTTATAPATPKVVSVSDKVATIETPSGQTQQVPTEALKDSEFWSNVNWPQVAQGGLGLAQMYMAYQDYKKGNYAGAGLTGATGAANVAASGLAGTAAQTAAGEALGGYLIPGLNIATGAYGGYQTAQAMGDMAAGKQRTTTGVVGGAASGAALGGGIGSIVPGVGTAIGAAIGAVVGAAAGGIGAYTGSSKKKPQMARDSIRKVMQQNGILNDKWQGTLADGSLYDFGKDGSHMKWSNIDKVAAANPNSWNSAVPLTDALATAYGWVGQKASDISAWYAKAAISNANDNPDVAKANARHFAQQQGVTYDMIKQKLDSALAENRVNQNQYNYYLQGAQDLTSGPTQAQGVQIQRPKKGEVARVSPGMYMNDKGVISPARTVRAALEKYANAPGKTVKPSKKDVEL